MHISIISVFPELYDAFVKTSLIKRAQAQQIFTLSTDSFFSFVKPKERIDAPTFGPTSGMLIRPEVIQKAIEDKERIHGKAFKIFFSPQGTKITQPVLHELKEHFMQQKHIMLIPSRYEGMDARVQECYADMVISLGDFVIMGGDLPAMVLIEGVTRLLPGVVGKQESVEKESFTGPFVDYPEYTEPVVWNNKEVPDIIRSGNHGAIQKWREQQAVKKTVEEHFAWLRACDVTPEQRRTVEPYIPPHYVVLMHDEIVLAEDTIGTTSVTSLDIHDIARSAKTYGIKKYFIVTPLFDQQKIVQTLLDFWHTGYGISYNPQRHEAVKMVALMSSLDAVISDIENIHGIKPIIVATSARSEDFERIIGYDDQAILWTQQRPILFMFGTGKGLASSLIKRCDYILKPIKGFSDFNHLSVRSAVAIILDRWLGINIKNVIK